MLVDQVVNMILLIVLRELTEVEQYVIPVTLEDTITKMDKIVATNVIQEDMHQLLEEHLAKMIVMLDPT